MTKKIVLLSGIAASALLPIPAFAQDAAQAPAPASAGTPAAASAVVPENVIIITARRREETAQEVPLAIATLDGRTINDTGAFSVQKIQQLAPTLQVYSSNPRNTAVNIRGIGVPFGLTNDGFEQGVGIYVDDVYYSRPASAVFDFLDVAQVEVLRGPQGTLYGKNTTAGAINIRTNQPTFDFEGSAEVSLGNYNFKQAKVAVSGPLTDTLAARIAVSSTDRRGTIFNATTNNWINEQDNLGVRAQLLWRPVDNLDVTLAADYSAQDPECCGTVFVGYGSTQRAANRQFPALSEALGYAPASLGPFERVTDLDAPLNAGNNIGGASLRAVWDLGLGTLTSVSAWRFWDWKPENDRDFSGLSVVSASNNPSQQDQYTQEFRYNYSSDNIDFVLGAFAFNQRIDTQGLERQGSDASRWNIAPSNPLFTDPSVLPLVQEWISSNYPSGVIQETREHLDPTEWAAQAIFGTAYATPQDTLYAWTDVGFNWSFADLNSDGVADEEDQAILDASIIQLDGGDNDGDGVENGAVIIEDFGVNFSVYDLTYDGHIDEDDLAVYDYSVNADFSGDGYVNGLDLAVLLSNWGPCADCPMDLNGDGEVNGTDLATLLVNWAVKPFSMLALGTFFIGWLFAEWLPQDQISSYIAGLILLAAAPCTAMVFVWSNLCEGEPHYTLSQVALNDVIMVFAFAPLVGLLLGVASITVPWDTLLLSVFLYIVVPLAAGYMTRTYLIRTKGSAWFDQVFLKRLAPLTVIGLLLTLVLLFSFQGEVILGNPLHIALIAVPLIIQTFAIFAVAYGGAAGRGDHAQAPHVGGQGTLALRIEQPFRLQLRLQLLERAPQRAFARFFQRLEDQLVVAACLVQSQPAARQHLQSLARLEFQPGAFRLEHRAAHLRARVLEGEIQVPGRRPRHVAQLALHGHQRKAVLQQAARQGVELGGGEDVAVDRVVHRHRIDRGPGSANASSCSMPRTFAVPWV